ncbi:MAG TPA: ATP-binding protein [Streptomyces sp.]|uniref:ATP-binding protein n=1 Tax=Streptomyces sp. TaxID=1931 RepID=UPI002C344538|nr:ATP-binding protein [Streptomyces sp.]HWU07929.1 ATP-binding protein [Streptomyces sp.]
MNDTKVPDTATTTPAGTVVRGDSTESIHWARKAARVFTDRLSPAPDPALAETLVLVVSELVTNALRHGGGRYTLRLSAGPRTVTAAVSDPDPALPRARTPDLDGVAGGFGWHMVRRLTEALTVTPGPGTGKTVCARLAR